MRAHFAYDDVVAIVKNFNTDLRYIQGATYSCESDQTSCRIRFVYNHRENGKCSHISLGVI